MSYAVYWTVLYVQSGTLPFSVSGGPDERLVVAAAAVKQRKAGKPLARVKWSVPANICHTRDNPRWTDPAEFLFAFRPKPRDTVK